MLERALMFLESRRVRIVLLSLAVFWGAVLGPLVHHPDRVRSFQSFVETRLKPGVAAIDPWIIWNGVMNRVFVCVPTPKGPEPMRCPDLAQALVRLPGALWQAALDVRHVGWPAAIPALVSLAVALGVFRGAIWNPASFGLALFVAAVCTIMVRALLFWMTDLLGAVLGVIVTGSAAIGMMGYLVDLAVTAPHGAELARTLMRPRT